MYFTPSTLLFFSFIDDDVTVEERLPVAAPCFYHFVPAVALHVANEDSALRKFPFHIFEGIALTEVGESRVVRAIASQ